MKKRFTAEQIIVFLKEAEAGISVKELGRRHGFSDVSFCQSFSRGKPWIIVRFTW